MEGVTLKRLAERVEGELKKLNPKYKLLSRIENEVLLITYNSFEDTLEATREGEAILLTGTRRRIQKDVYASPEAEYFTGLESYGRITPAEAVTAITRRIQAYTDDDTIKFVKPSIDWRRKKSQAKRERLKALGSQAI